MDETTASHWSVVVKGEPSAASSHHAGEPSLGNEPRDTSKNAALRGFCSRLRSFIFKAVLPLIILLVLLVWYLYWLLSKLMFIEDVSSPVQVAEHPNPNKAIFDSLRKAIDISVKERRAAAKLRLLILLPLLLSLMIVVSVPSLKRIKVLGLPLWEWTVIVALVIVSYHYISLLEQRIVKKLFQKMTEDKHDVVYYADGLRRSVNNVIFCVFILLAWELYFRSSRHGLRRYGVSEKALDIGTGTAVSLLVFAFLLLAKNTVILSWESHVMYRRFADNIGKAGLQLYFLDLVSGSKFDIFSPRKEEEGKGAGEETKNSAAEENNKKQGGGNEKKSKKANRFISRNWDLNHPSTHRKKKMAKYFILATKLSSRKDVAVPEGILEQWQSLKHPDHPDKISKKEVQKYIDEHATKESGKEKIQAEIDDLFAELADCQKNKKNSTSPDEISYSTFEEWMTKAFKNCLSLGYTLTDAEGAVDNLNRIIRVFLCIVVFLCWLLLTGITSTKAFVTIASPIIAVAFIFGDMAKAVFEGIIFFFVTHPFIIGDLCIIDDTQLEVKQMDALKTTFHKINSEDEVLYPNKVLAKKKILNLKGNLDGRDCVELSLDKSVDIKSLEDEIEKFFKSTDGKFEKNHVMMVEEIGETIKIAIHFKHIMNVQDITAGQCFKKKKEQRSDILKEVNQKIQTKESFSAKDVAKSSG